MNHLTPTVDRAIGPAEYAPTAAVVLDRMAEAILAHDTVSFMEEVQFFWRKGWKLRDMPEPAESNPVRRALKACLMERMVEVWRAPPKNEDEEAPSWCQNVPGLSVELSVVSAEYRNSFSLESPIFRKRNIFAPRDFMFFV